MDTQQSLHPLATLLEESKHHIQGTTAIALFESTDTLLHFLNTAIDSPPIAYIHILGTHRELATRKTITDFDVWASGSETELCGSMSMLSRNTHSTIEVDRNDAASRQDALAAFAASLFEIPMAQRRLTIEKRIRPYDKEAIQRKIQRLASNVRYGGRIAVEFHIANQIVEVSTTSQTTVTFPPGLVALEGPQIEVSATCPKIETLWEVQWPYSDNAPDLMQGGISGRRRLPRFSDIEVTPPVQSWDSRLMEAIVDGTQGEIRLDDPLPHRGPPMLRAMREKGTAIRTTSSNSNQRMNWRQLMIATWGNDE